MSGQPKKMLIFELWMMGDAVMSLPFVRGALQDYDVYVCCSSRGMNVFRCILPEDHILCWDPPWNRERGKYAWRHWRKSGIGNLIRRLRSLRPDIALSAWADTRLHVLMALSGAGTRAGFPMNDRNYYGHERPWRRRQLFGGRLLYNAASILLSRPLLTHELHHKNEQQHHLEDWKQMAEQFEIELRVDTPWFPARTFSIPENVQYFLRSVRREEQPVVLIHPGARNASRCWPLERFMAVVRQALQPQALPVIMVSSPEIQVTEAVNKNMIIASPSNFEELCGVIDSSDILLCNDTGVAHLGSALGKKVIALFGSSNPNWVAPYENEDNVIGNNVCPHSPCFNHCVMPSYICLEAITPERVISKLTSLLEQETVSLKNKRLRLSDGKA